jgi:hypothetical protein
VGSGQSACHLLLCARACSRPQHRGQHTRGELETAHCLQNALLYAPHWRAWVTMSAAQMDVIAQSQHPSNALVH